MESTSCSQGYLVLVSACSCVVRDVAQLSSPSHTYRLNLSSTNTLFSMSNTQIEIGASCTLDSTLAATGTPPWGELDSTLAATGTQPWGELDSTLAATGTPPWGELDSTLAATGTPPWGELLKSSATMSTSYVHLFRPR